MLGTNVQQASTARPLPTTAFRINGSAVLEKGLKLTTNHSLGHPDPVLFIGDRYFPCDRSLTIQNVDSLVLAPCARIENFVRESRKPVKKVACSFLEAPFLLSIDPRVAIAPNARTRIRFWSGIEHSGTTVHHDRRTGEMLLEIPDKGHATIYYSDGRVTRVLRLGDALMAPTLTLMEQAELRLQHAREQIEGVEHQKGRDFWYFQIINLLLIGGKRSHEIADVLYDFLEGAAKHLLMGAAYPYYRTVVDTHFGGIRFAKNLTSVGGKHRKPPAAVIARKKARSAADRQRHLDKIGNGGGKKQKSAQK